MVAIALTRALPTGSWWWKATVLGGLNIGAFFPLLFVAAYHLPGGVAATLGAAQPLVVAVLVVLVLGESFSAWRLFWGIVGITGVALVVLDSTAALGVAGVAAGLLSAVSMGFGVTLTKKWGRPTGVPAMGLAGWQLTAGGLFGMGCSGHCCWAKSSGWCSWSGSVWPWRRSPPPRSPREQNRLCPCTRPPRDRRSLPPLPEQEEHHERLAMTGNTCPEDHS